MCYLLVFVVSDLNNIRYIASVFLCVCVCVCDYCDVMTGTCLFACIEKEMFDRISIFGSSRTGLIEYIYIFDMEEIQYFMSIIKIEWINSIQIIVVIHVHEFKQFQPNPLFMQNRNGEGVRRGSNFNHIFCSKNFRKWFFSLSVNMKKCPESINSSSSI